MSFTQPPVLKGAHPLRLSWAVSISPLRSISLVAACKQGVKRSLRTWRTWSKLVTFTFYFHVTKLKAAIGGAHFVQWLWCSRWKREEAGCPSDILSRYVSAIHLFWNTFSLLFIKMVFPKLSSNMYSTLVCSSSLLSLHPENWGFFWLARITDDQKYVQGVLVLPRP